MTPQQFITKWKASTLKERSAAQEHFLDLCRLIGHPTPAESDPTGEHFTFERGAGKTGGGEGWADVWKKGCFAWEYKGKQKDLNAAFAQLQRYAIALENPPLLVVSDMETIIIHTNWTNTVQNIHTITLDELESPEARQQLAWLFTEPERFRPGITREMVTARAAEAFAALAQRLSAQGCDHRRVAHFVNKLLFCMFAEDIGILPGQLFTRMLEACARDANRFAPMAASLFTAMKSGGLFGVDEIPWFNGGLFDDADALPLDAEGVKLTLTAAKLDWSDIEPSIFGTLFERGLDPAKRSQLGAHYTDRDSIMRIVGPVVVEPLVREWTAVKAALTPSPSPKGRGEKSYRAFLDKLRATRVLDPACGSGNFLYLSLIELKNLEHRVMLEGEIFGFQRDFPQVGPQNVLGIEINDYAAELARVTVWIGDIQWGIKNGLGYSTNPILKTLDTITCRDALITPLPPGEGPGVRAGVGAEYTETVWPAADCIVGNPPFLGDKKMLAELGDEYVTRLRTLYKGRVPGGADLVTYWFEKARAEIEAGRVQRAGLVATNSVRGGANRKVLERICASGRIFTAWSDEPWINEGAAVRVSLVCFEANPPQPPFVKGGGESQSPPLQKVEGTSQSPPLQKGDLGGFVLDGNAVSAIYADLTGPAERVGLEPAPGCDLTTATPLKENEGVAFQGPTKGGSFDVPGELARQWLNHPNPHGKPNSEVVKPWANGQALTGRWPDMWIIDFAERNEEQAALFEAPFAHVVAKVKPERETVARERRRNLWWQFNEIAPGMRQAIAGLARYMATPEVAKHRVFVWCPASIAPDKNLVIIARDDDTTFGILHSRFHELWSLRMGTSLEDRPRYTSSTTFRTFPFPTGLEPSLTRPAATLSQGERGSAAAVAVACLPSPSGRGAGGEGAFDGAGGEGAFQGDKGASHAQTIAAAAIRLVELRDNWLNPAEWVERVPEVCSPRPVGEGLGVRVRAYPDRILAKPGCEKELVKRTLTNLYNLRPQWLLNAHAVLDAAVAAAYGWPADLGEDDILARLLTLNRERAGRSA